MTRFWSCLLRVTKPLIMLASKIGFPHRKITGRHYYLLRDEITPGTVILSRRDWEFSNVLNPVEIKHAAIYVGSFGEGKIKYVLEATGKGVVLTDLVSFLVDKDMVIGCRPNFIEPSGEYIEELHRNVGILKGAPYDYMFEQGSEALYCFELAATCLKLSKPEIPLKEYEIVKGRRIYDHNTFLDKKHFTVVFDSRKMFI